MHTEIVVHTATRAPRSFSYPKGLLTVTARADVTVLPVTGQISRPPSGQEAIASLACTRSVLHARPCRYAVAARARCGVRASGASSACPYQRVLAQASQIESTVFASDGAHPPVCNQCHAVLSPSVVRFTTRLQLYSSVQLSYVSDASVSVQY